MDLKVLGEAAPIAGGIFLAGVGFAAGYAWIEGRQSKLRKALYAEFEASRQELLAKIAKLEDRISQIEHSNHSVRMRLVNVLGMDMTDGVRVQIKEAIEALP
jgi:hypothetical protein